MAKKKLSASYQLFHTPISLPRLGVLALIATSLLSINLSAFLEKPATAFPVSSISQKTLQDVLGTTMSIGEPLPSPKENLSNPKIQYWQEVLRVKPDYRDAHIILATLSYNKNNCLDTKYYIDKAYNLDPNNKTLQDLLPHLATCLK